MAAADLKIYLDSVTAANQRDVPYYSNTTGTVISGGASGTLAWSTNGDKRGWGRIDGSFYCYYELEVVNATTIQVKRSDQLGDSTTENVSVVAGNSYTTLVHGVTVPLNGTLTAGHIARVYPAVFALDNSTFYVPRGAAGDPQDMYVNNPGTVTHKESYLRIARGTWFNNTTNTPVQEFNSTVIAPTVDTYAVTISNGTSGGTKKYTFTGTFNTYVVDNCAADTTYDISTSGLTFKTSTPLPANTDTATCYVDGLADALELAPDNAGVPGTWVTWNGTDGVLLPLNRAGFSDKQIPAAQTITVWMRANPGVSHTIGRGNAKFYCDSQLAET